jgi:hypothetical protein
VGIISKKQHIDMTTERKIRIQEEEAEFIENYAEYGFHNSDEMISRALELLKQELDMIKELELSADLYAEMYESDEETKEWTEASTQDWD